MNGSARGRQILRRAASILATVGLLAGMVAVTTGKTSAEPSTSITLTYHFTNCTGPVGTPTTFDAVKQPSGAAALHIVNGGGIFVAMEAIDVDTETILFKTPGFDHNNLPTITCQVPDHPVSHSHQEVTGIITPIG